MIQALSPPTLTRLGMGALLTQGALLALVPLLDLWSELNSHCHLLQQCMLFVWGAARDSTIKNVVNTPQTGYFCETYTLGFLEFYAIHPWTLHWILRRITGHPQTRHVALADGSGPLGGSSFLHRHLILLGYYLWDRGGLSFGWFCVLCQSDCFVISW